MGEPWVEALYRRYGPLVFRRARTLLGSDEAAWDVVQEVFIRALRSREGFQKLLVELEERAKADGDR